MAMDDADSQPVMSGDADVSTFGSGQVVCTDEENKNYLTYSGDHNYVISAEFDSDTSKKPVSVRSKEKVEAVAASSEEKVGAVSAQTDGRDFAGQVIKKIDGKTYILIGNQQQLRAIGTDAEVFTAVYQTDYVLGRGHIVDTDSNGDPIQLYGGDADLLQTQNGYRDYGFHSINDVTGGTTTNPKYYTGVNQETGQPYLDATHVTQNKDSLTEASWKTGEKYTIGANYIVFRDIDLGGSSAPWTPLMFNGTMYGAKTVSGEKLWNGNTILDSTALTATDADHRPVISNVYVNKNTTLNVNEYIGIGFFATITNQTNTANIGISGGTAIVKNLELNDVHVENNATQSGVNQTILNAVTSTLGEVLGGLVDFLLSVLSFGSTSTDLRSTLSNLLNARANDPTIFATGAFAGRIYGDVVVEDCLVSGTVSVSNVKDRTGGFVGYTEGMTEYSGLSQALGTVSGALAAILNAVPAVGLGDLVTILLENALPVNNLIPTNYIAPQINNCEVNGLTGDVGKTTTKFAGGFVGQQIGTRIADCSVKDSEYAVRAQYYGGGFCGLARDAEIKGTLDGVGIDLSSIVQKIHPQSVLIDCDISNCTYDVSGTDCLGGFIGVMTSSYAVDCTIDCGSDPIDIHGSGDYAGGFAGYASVGWKSTLGKDENNENSLLGTVRQLVTGLLSSDKSTGQKLLSLMGVSPSAILGCQVYSSELTVEADKSFAGGLVGKGEGIYLGKSNQDAYDAIAAWNSGTLRETPKNRAVILSGLKSVDAGVNYAGGAAGYMGSAAFQGMLNDVVGLGDFIGFNVSDVSVTGVEGGYTVAAGNYNAGGGFGCAVGGNITNVNLNELKRVEAVNRAAGFVGVAGPGELVGTGGLTVNLLGLDKVLEVSNLLNVGQGVEVHITGCNVTGISDGFEVEATGSNQSGESFEFTASGFIADSNSTKIENSHTDKLKSVTAASTKGYAGCFIGTSQTGGLAEVANNDSTSVKSLIEANGLVRAIGYLIPSYTNCTTTFVDGGYVEADIAGGFVADFESGTVDNSTISTVDDAQDPKWTKTMKELYDPDAVNATGDLNKQFAVFNIDRVRGYTYGGGFGGKLRSGALANSGSGISILGNTGLSIGVSDLIGVMNAYVPTVKNAGVYFEDGFTVVANDIRSDDSSSGSAGGFAGYTSGAQISHCDVYRLKHTTVVPPDDLEAVSAQSYFNSALSAYAVTGGHYAGGYVGNMDIGSAASLGGGLKVLGEIIQLTNVLTALSVVVTTIEHSDVQGAGGGFSVIADGTDPDDGKVGMSGGYAGAVYGGHIQNSHCKNFYYIIGQETAGGYVGNLQPGNVANLLGDGSILSSLVDVDSALASLVEDFVPTIRNSTTSCVPCGGAVRAQAASDDSHQRGCAGGYCGHNEGGHIWGLNDNTWKDQNDGEVGSANFGHSTEGNYIGEKHICTAWRIRSVYGYEYAGGFTGYMESADTADTGSIKLLGGLIKATNVISALSMVYPTEENTAVYGPLRNMDVNTWNAWVEYVGKYGGYGAELAKSGTASSQSELNGKLSKYIYGCNVVAGRSSHDNMLITEGGNAGGYVGSAYGAQIWGDKNVGDTAGTGCNVQNLRFVKGANAAGGYVGAASAASVADVSTNASDGFLQRLLNSIISTPGDLASVMQATITTIRKAVVNPDNSSFGFTVDGIDGAHPQFAGGFAGSLEAAVIGSRKGESQISVNGLRSVDGEYYAGGFVGLADVGSVASVSSSGTGSTSILSLINAGSVDLLDIFRTYIYHSDVNGVDDGIIVRAYSSAQEGILSEKRFSGCAGGFGGGVMNGSVKNSNVTNLNTVIGQNYTGGFIGHLGKNGLVDVDDASVSGVAGATAGVLDIFGTVVSDCDVTGIDEGAVIAAVGAEEPIAGGYAGYADLSRISDSRLTHLKQVTSKQIAGGFVGKTNMKYLVSAEVDSALVQVVLGILNSLLKILQVNKLEEIDLINTDELLSGLGITNLVGLKLLSDGDLLYVNLLGLRVGVSLVKATGATTGTAVVTIGDSSVELPYNEDGIDTSGQNSEVVINLIKGNRTQVDNCYVEGISDGYDVYGGGSTNKDGTTEELGYAGGFVGYNKEGKFTSNTMVYCDVVRGTQKKVGPFSGETYLKSSYSVNDIASIERVDNEENHYSIYRKTDLSYALKGSDNRQIGAAAQDDPGSDYKRIIVTHLAEPIDPDVGEPYYKIYKKLCGAKLAADTSGNNAKSLDVYASGAKVVLMSDTPTYPNGESIIPDPSESKEPCDETIDLTIQKIWNDNSNADKSRPARIKVRIWQHTLAEDGSDESSSLFTDADVIPDIMSEGWFLITESDNGRADSATWTRVIKGLPVYTNNSGTISYYSYTVEEAPLVNYEATITYDESGSTATATIVNTPKPFEIDFKYYDRYQIDATYAGIDDKETKYTVTLKTVPDEFITYDSKYDVEEIDFKGLIAQEAVEFSEKGLAVNNVICDYDLWTSQKEAVTEIAKRKYFVDGVAVSYSDNTIFHTDYLSRPLSSGDKWVNYYNSDGEA